MTLLKDKGGVIFSKTGLPTDGSTIHVTFFFKLAGDPGFTPVDYQYTAFTGAGGAESMHVGDLDAETRNQAPWGARITVTVHDADHGPVAGATVSGH